MDILHVLASVGIVAITTAGIYILHNVNEMKKMKGLPGPPRHFISGNMKDLGEAIRKDDRHIDYYFLDQAKKYGNILWYRLPWPLPSMLMVADVDIATRLMQSDQMLKSFTYINLLPIIGKDSLLIKEGDEWRHLRKAFNPAFSKGYLERMVPAIAEETIVFANRLNRAAQIGTIVTLNDYLTSLTVDVIARVGFSRRLHAQDVEEGQHPLVADFAVTLHGTTLGWRERLNPVYWIRYKAAEKRLDNHFRKMMREREQDNKGVKAVSVRDDGADWADRDMGEIDSGGSDSIEAKDVLDLAMNTVYSDGSKLSESVIISQLKTFFFAGHDTTSSLMSWVFYLLSKHPKVLADVREELDSIFGPETAEDLDTLADTMTQNPKLLNEMKLGLAVIKETLRLYPPGATARWTNDPTIEIQGTPIKGWVVYMPTMLMQRSPEYWGPTADEFDPYRFLKPLGEAVAAQFPFSKPKRSCIGQELAYLEARIILACIARKFDFQFVPGAMPAGTEKVPPEGKTVRRKANAPTPSEKKKSLIRKNVQLRFDAEQLTFQWQEKLFAKRVASRETLIQSARYLRPEHYREVIEERNLEAWCGYPLCGNDKAEVSSRYRISLASRKVFDQSALAQFCSKECLTKSRFLEAQLSDEPVWTRNIIRPSKEQDPDITVVGMQEKIDDYKIEEASAPPTKQRVREQYIHQLLSQLPPPIADITIHERTPQMKSPITPSQDIIVPTAVGSEKGEADAIEGFRVSFDSRDRQDKVSTLVLRATEKPNKHGKSSGQKDTSFTSLAIADDDILQDAMNTMMQLRLHGEHIPQSDLNEQNTSVEKQQPPAEQPKVVKQRTTPPSTAKTE
ncbi:hypothetical protein BZG36_04340, partial [Bifiguratus adelaidae]